MATKQVSLRIGPRPLDPLTYLGILPRPSDAQIVVDRINTLADAVRPMAEHAHPALQDDRQFLKNGGTIISIISLEEPQALQTIQRGLQDLRLPGPPLRGPSVRSLSVL